MKREHLFVLTVGLLFGLVASGCRERNPAYHKGNDAAVPKDAALSPDAPAVVIDSKPEDTRLSQPEVGPSPDTRADAHDAGGDVLEAGGDGKIPTLDGLDAFEVPPVLPDAEVSSDLRKDKEKDKEKDSLSPDTLADAIMAPVDSETDLPTPLDVSEIVTPDAGQVLFDSAVDATADGPEIVVDAPEVPDSLEGDALEDSLPMLDVEAVDTTVEKLDAP